MGTCVWACRYTGLRDAVQLRASQGHFGLMLLLSVIPYALPISPRHLPPHPPQVDTVTAEMLKSINLTATVASVTIQQVGPPKPAFQQGAPFQGGGRGKQ